MYVSPSFQSATARMPSLSYRTVWWWKSSGRITASVSQVSPSSLHREDMLLTFSVMNSVSTYCATMNAVTIRIGQSHLGLVFFRRPEYCLHSFCRVGTLRRMGLSSGCSMINGSPSWVCRPWAISSVNGS